VSVQALDDLLDETLKLIVCLRERTPHAAMPRKLNALCQVHALSAFEAALAVHPHLASVKAAVDSVSAELRAKRRQQAAAGRRRFSRANSLNSSTFISESESRRMTTGDSDTGSGINPG